MRAFKASFFDPIKGDIVEVIQSQVDKDRAKEAVNRCVSYVYCVYVCVVCVYV